MNTINSIKKEKIKNFLQALNTEVDVHNYVDVEDIEFDNAYNSIYDMISDKGGFYLEVIYYSEAMKYLSENDSSLTESLTLALDMGYSLEKLNSGLLASLLKSENVRNDFSELENEINNFFAELSEDNEI